jgi:hypothetical protein
LQSFDRTVGLTRQIKNQTTSRQVIQSDFHGQAYGEESEQCPQQPRCYKGCSSTQKRTYAGNAFTSKTPVNVQLKDNECDCRYTICDELKTERTPRSHVDREVKSPLCTNSRCSSSSKFRSSVHRDSSSRVNTRRLACNDYSSAHYSRCDYTTNVHSLSNMRFCGCDRCEKCNQSMHSTQCEQCGGCETCHATDSLRVLCECHATVTECSQTDEKPTCSFGKQSSKRLESKTFHKLHTPNAVKQKPLKYGCCDEQNTRISHLTAYENVRTAVEKRYVCSCLSKHVLETRRCPSAQAVHAHKKLFDCGYCSKQFAGSSTCRQHTRVHTREKPFKCDHCFKRFTSKFQLTEHQRIHTGEKPFCCKYCFKQFTSKRYLKAHQRLHTGEKPYCCAYCPKQFANATSFKRHERIHTGEKPYGCDYCFKRFIS